jgi:hypothetical protein
VVSFIENKKEKKTIAKVLKLAKDGVSKVLFTFVLIPSITTF